MLWLGIAQLLGLPPKTPLLLLCSSPFSFPRFFDDGATQIKQKQGRAWNLVALLVIKPVLQNNWSHFKLNKNTLWKFGPCTNQYSPLIWHYIVHLTHQHPLSFKVLDPSLFHMYTVYLPFLHLVSCKLFFIYSQKIKTSSPSFQ